MFHSKIIEQLKVINLDKKNLIKCILKLSENNEILSIINLLININFYVISNIDKKINK